eukprot:202195-Prymnesium_polylepis.1
MRAGDGCVEAHAAAQWCKSGVGCLDACRRGTTRITCVGVDAVAAAVSTNAADDATGEAR